MNLYAPQYLKNTDRNHDGIQKEILLYVKALPGSEDADISYINHEAVHE